MADHSINGPIKAGNPIVDWVWYEGTDYLYQGEAVCFNTDYGTETDADGRRCSMVERPTYDSTVFAGVSARNYTASSTGQFIEINVPGSKSIPVALGVDTVIDTGILTFSTKGRYNEAVSTGLGTDGGRFHSGVYRGRGSAIPRQTVTALLEDGTAGTWSLAADGLTLTVTATAGLAAGDTVVLLGGQDDATGTVIPGKYVIASITSATVMVLTAPSTGATAVDVTTAALTCTGYAYTGNPTALCDLLDGDESGGIEFMNPPDAGNAAMPYMVGGKTYVCGGITLAALVGVNLAQAVSIGDKKCFIVLADLATSDFTITPVTDGLQLDGSTALDQVLTMDDTGDGIFLEFGGSLWHTRDLRVGATEA